MSLLFEEISLSPKLELCRANQDQIRNQRPRLRRNKLFLGRKERGGFPDQLRKLYRYFILDYLLVCAA